MKKTICDKCKMEDYSIVFLLCSKAIIDYGNYVSTEIDLCDRCRRKLGIIIKKWLEDGKYD